MNSQRKFRADGPGEKGWRMPGKMSASGCKQLKVYGVDSNRMLVPHIEKNEFFHI